MAPASHNNFAPLVAVLIQCMAVACNYLASKPVVRVDVINEREAVLAAGEGRPLEVFLLCIASWHASFLHRQEPPRSGLAGLVHRFASHKSNPRDCPAASTNPFKDCCKKRKKQHPQRAFPALCLSKGAAAS